MRILLITPARRFIANRFGLGYQIPLGLLFIGGPLIDAGHTVRLIDNDAYGWPDAQLAREAQAFAPDVIMLGHTGSTAAHAVCLRTARALRQAVPGATVVYGGVYPTYAAAETLAECGAIDIIVRGEAEQICLDLVAALALGDGLSRVRGIAWRNAQGKPVLNPPAPTLRDLDAYRPGWELVDWPRYRLFGFGRSAGMQFSRGCPLSCTYCGQWMFWRKWRHRSAANVVQQLRILKEQFGVRIVWFADENFAGDRDAARELIDALIEADLGLSLNINMTAANIVRDADLLARYKQAGVDYVVMGVESLEDGVVEAIGKDNPFEVSCRAVALLRQHHMLALTNIIMGLEEETVRTMVSKFWKALTLDSDVLNVCYITPHHWTADGRATKPEHIVDGDHAHWTYRNMVLATRALSPVALFVGVKLVEGAFHLRPAALWRLLFERDARLRRLLQAGLATGIRAVVAEVIEFSGMTPALMRQWRALHPVQMPQSVMP